MKDQFEQFNKDLAKVIEKLRDMIVFIAERSMPHKDFMEFIAEFSDKKREDEKILKD